MSRDELPFASESALDEYATNCDRGGLLNLARYLYAASKELQRELDEARAERDAAVAWREDVAKRATEMTCTDVEPLLISGEEAYTTIDAYCEMQRTCRLAVAAYEALSHELAARRIVAERDKFRNQVTELERRLEYWTAKAAKRFQG